MVLRLSLRQWTCLSVAVVGVTLASASCHSDLPDGAEGSGPTPPGACATPNDGCPCGPSGTVVPCGKVSHKDPSGYVVCMTGDRTCVGGKWGACETTGDVKTASYTVGSGMGMDPAGGVKTMSLGVPVDCTGAIGLGVNLCVGGSKDGKKCSKKPPNCPGGTCSPGKCEGGANNDNACTLPADCPGGVCKIGDGKCVGGSKNGDGCKLACPGGACNQYAGICDKGTNDDKGCNVAADCPGGTCDISEKGLCVGGLKDLKHCKDKCGTGSQCSPGKCNGGPNDKNACFTDLECTGGTCKYGNGKCVGGANNGIDCDTDCPLGLCSAGKCNGGVNNNNACYVDAECPGGTCKIGDGKCIGGTNAGGSCKSECPGGSCFMPGSTGFSNPCDPYCTQYVDTPIGEVFDGGIVTPGGGLTVNPDAGDGGGAGGFASTQGGVTACGGAINLNGPACTPPGYSTCQQDFRCDTVTNQCVWNGGPGYFDPSAGGVDLTVGAPCGPSGSGAAVAPVCNRGSAPLAAGATITFHVTAPPAPPSGCSNLGAPTSSFVLPTTLNPGQCVNFNLGNSTGNKFITVNAGAPGPVAEGPGLCANNSAAFKDDGAPGCGACGSCNTRLTGTIYDPRGVNPLPNVLVYVPASPVTPLTDGVACDTCASLISGNPQAQAVTGPDGTFTLNNVPPGSSFPLVIMAGRWRRIVTVPAIAECGVGTLAAASSRLPRNKAEGNIPLTALVMSQGDQLQCLLRKVGIDDAEFTNGAGTGRIHLYTHNSGQTFAGGTSGPANIWGNPANLSRYSAVVQPCDNNHTTYPPPAVPGPNTTNPPNPTATAAQSTNIKNFVDAGGRLFTTHWMSHDFVHVNWPGPGGPVQPEFGSNVDADREAPSFPYTIDTSTPIGNTLAQWGVVVGAATAGPPPRITFNSWRHLSRTVNTAGGAVRLSFGDSTQPPVSHPQNASQWGGPHVNMYQFDTPWGSPPASQCGRVVVSQSHVSSGGGAFPGGCGLPTVAMTPQEKAFEFLLFNSQACLGLPPPIIPPVPPPLPSITVVRDYQGICGVGEVPVWGVFYWEAVVPPGTSLKFSAGTAASQAALPATETAPGVKVIGNGTTTVLPPGWACDGCPAAPVSVDNHLRNDPPPPNSQSREWLRVFMTFTPLGSVAPTVLAWRQQYSCQPAE